MRAADTLNAEAFLAFQKGVDLMSSRQFSQAAVELRRAYLLDTNYTRAWAYLARSEYIPLRWGGTTNDLAVTFKRLSSEVERFHAQRPDDAALASVRVFVAMTFEWDWETARTGCWDILRNQKPDPDVLNNMAWYYFLIEGHPEPALHANQQAITLSPENLVYAINRVNVLFSFARYDEGVRAFRSRPPG